MTTCGKRIFQSPAAAKRGLRSAQRASRRFRERAECRFYWCPECHAYHLTSETTTRGRVDRALDKRRAFREAVQTHQLEHL